MDFSKVMHSLATLVACALLVSLNCMKLHGFKVHSKTVCENWLSLSEWFDHRSHEPVTCWLGSSDIQF